MKRELSFSKNVHGRRKYLPDSIFFRTKVVVDTKKNLSVVNNEKSTAGFYIFRLFSTLEKALKSINLLSSKKVEFYLFIKIYVQKHISKNHM